MLSPQRLPKICEIWLRSKKTAEKIKEFVKTINVRAAQGKVTGTVRLRLSKPNPFG